MTPGTTIKIEADSPTDIYDASPQGLVYKAASHRRRQNSKSTAQLTTPTSSPEGKCERCHSIGDASSVKSESINDGSERQSVFYNNCTPPTSGPERDGLPKEPTCRRAPTTPQRSPLGPLQASTKDRDIQERSSRARSHLTIPILHQKLIVENNRRNQTAVQIPSKRYQLAAAETLISGKAPRIESRQSSRPRRLIH